jgi:hypothetical protein
MKYLFNRFKEPSTWAGIAAGLTPVLVIVPTERWLAGAIALAAALAVLLKEDQASDTAVVNKEADNAPRI